MSTDRTDDPRSIALWERALCRLDQHERWLAHARAALRDRRMERAALGEEPRPPQPPVLAAIFATGAIGLSFTLPLHDIVFSRLLPLPEQALFASFAAACLVSAVTTVTALGAAGLVLRDRDLHMGPGAVAAFLLAGALLLLRLAGTTELAQWTLAAGFSVLELACVLLLETYAHRLAARRIEYRQDREMWLAAEAQIEVAGLEVDLAERELQTSRLEAGAFVGGRVPLEGVDPARARGDAAKRREVEEGRDDVGLPLLSGEGTADEPVAVHLPVNRNR